MTRQNTLTSSNFSRYFYLSVAVILLGFLATASAQYQSAYPYSRPSSSPRQLPNSARHIGGFTGNPYTNTRARPTGLPVSGNRHSYYGATGGGNPLAQSRVSKPFSNLRRPQPLINSQEAARIEVARGLWRY